MKKIIIGLSLFCFVLLIGCKKYLTINPKSSFDEAYVFGSVGSATSAVMSVYGHLTGDNGYGFYLSLAYQVDSDDDIGSSNSSPGGGDNATKAFARYNAAPGNAILLGPFNQLYAGIESANICIKNIPLMNAYTNGSASEKLALQRLHGEALTLRAQMYFELIRNWGDIPAPFVPSSDQTNLYLPKTDRDIIYDKLLDDLLLAESLVPWRGENGAGTDERITKGAVKAVRAKLALFRGGYSLRNASGIMERRADYLKYYQIAKTEASQIIQSGKHALNPSFQALFKDNMDAHKIDPSGEVLFEIAMAGGASTSDSRISAFDGPNVGAQVGGGQVKPLPTYLYAFSQLDTRMSVTIADYSVNTSGNYIGAFLSTLASGKFRRDWITPAVPLGTVNFFNGINWPVIRYSDVLLMFAEADNEINGAPSDSAKNAYEAVRKRAFGANTSAIGVTPTDKTGFFNAVVNERYFEFGGEGIRKHDLIRWNLLYTKLQETRANLIKIGLRQAPYNQLPQFRFYKPASTTLVWADTPYGPQPNPNPVGYTAISWTGLITTAFATTVGETFQPNHSELLPFPQTVIIANPNIKQDFGY